MAMLEIRRATAADAAAMSMLHRASIRELCGPAYEPEEIASWIEALEPEHYPPLMEKYDVFVAEEDRVVGFCILDLAGAELDALYLDPAAVGRGIGRRLLEVAEDRARASGLQKLTLKATLNAVGFYEACGFERVGESTCQRASGFELGCVDMVKALGSRAARSATGENGEP